MLNSVENTEPLPELQDITLSEGYVLNEYRFTELELNKLRRKGAEKNEYQVFSSEDEFKVIEAETATLALNASEISKPYKITHSYCRFDDIIALENLEYVEKKEEPVVNNEVIAQNADEVAPSTGETPPPMEEPKPEENKS